MAWLFCYLWQDWYGSHVRYVMIVLLWLGLQDSLYMAGSSEPQHFFAAGCVFADFAIAVIFYPFIKTL